ncbi:MAG: exodeoxyribonuclease V subunit alpha [Proteobacteria bacterium]|nr:exodeoxyribonuclease V subunit alpha [Pseudomonadota bacterium]MBU1648161.1 exodeoxyribonuclease V subunit alpha [Pseudomonadota bacterium]MBU1985854.1 exodeoxyribonuclease V subunit alpha [Pseudomonadota bacterium]
MAPPTPGPPGPSPIFSPLDTQFARFMTRRSGLSGTAADRFEQLIKRLSASLTDGHSCLVLTSAEEHFLSTTGDSAGQGCPHAAGSRDGVSVLLSADITTPLVLWQSRLYLQRYFRYELRLAEQLKGLARKQCVVPQYKAELDGCFGKEQEIDWQRRAAEMALTRHLALISGGPGTGKTSTVVRILGLLFLMLGPDLQIAMAAPTGKAAMRLKESIAASLAGLPFSEEIKEKIPTTASTLHRLLGVRHNSPHFRHNHTNPLPWDVVVVDEASMVDLAMMSKLVDALKPGARLILLGDKDQLASVESGAVLADCIQALPENTITLQKSYRFNQEISAFASAVNDNDSGAAWAMLNREDHETTAVSLLHEPVATFIATRYSHYLQQALAVHDDDRKEDDIRQLFQCFKRFRILCATRRGAGGVEAINRQMEQSLAAAGYPSQPGSWYPGRPVIILNNDYGLNLFNGDIGICLPERTTLENDNSPGQFKVWFEREDGSLKGYQPYRLPACETVFAMTIHKSQGSEFAEILVVLPGTDTPILTRELIYTAVTRAQKRVLIASDQTIFQAALNRTISRSSGLYAMLISSG